MVIFHGYVSHNQMVYMKISLVIWTAEGQWRLTTRDAPKKGGPRNINSSNGFDFPIENQQGLPSGNLT